MLRARKKILWFLENSFLLKTFRSHKFHSESELECRLSVETKFTVDEFIEVVVNMTNEVVVT